MQVEWSAYTSVDDWEVEKVQRQRIASFIGYVFQPTYAAFIEKPPHWRRTAESLSLLGNIFSSSLA